METHVTIGIQLQKIKKHREFIFKMSRILQILHYQRVYGLQYLFTVRWTGFSKVLLMCSCSKHLRVYGLQYLFTVRLTRFSKVLLMCSCSKHLRVYGLQYLFTVRLTRFSKVLLMCSCSKHLRVYGLQYLFTIILGIPSGPPDQIFKSIIDVFM